MKARELMTKNPECVTRQDSLQRAAQIMRERIQALRVESLAYS